MNAQELLELMKNRRSVRSYTDELVSDKDIKMIVFNGLCIRIRYLLDWKYG
ncbi:MAG: hypothetical protein ACTSRZ_07115 [Promethearchaeota archaeon]